MFFGKFGSYTVANAGIDPGPNVALIQDTLFENNNVLQDFSNGGAVYDWISDGLTIDNCTFRNNSVRWGEGGVLGLQSVRTCGTGYQAGAVMAGWGLAAGQGVRGKAGSAAKQGGVGACCKAVCVGQDGGLAGRVRQAGFGAKQVRVW